MQHIMIVGRNGVGKSTLIRALTDALSLPVYGVITEKEQAAADGYCPVTIRLFGEPKQYTADRRVGLCREGHSIAFPEVFDRFSDRIRFRTDGVIVFDELGFLESSALEFTSAVLHTLDTAPLCICAVRDKQTAFLDAVRTHPRARVFHIDEENRDALRAELIALLKREV